MLNIATGLRVVAIMSISDLLSDKGLLLAAILWVAATVVKDYGRA